MGRLMRRLRIRIRFLIMSDKYYLDSCIWLNLFKKEGDARKGISYWEIALNFLERVENEGGVIYVSTIVLKELYFVVGKDFGRVKRFFMDCDFIEIVKTTGGDYDLARNFEKEDLGRISFYDYLHVAITRRLSCSFLTRDKDLIRFADNRIKVGKPEDLIG